MYEMKCKLHTFADYKTIEHNQKQYYSMRVKIKLTVSLFHTT